MFFGTFPPVFIGLVLCELAVEDDDTPADSHLLAGPVLPQTWQQRGNLVSQQATALSCMDFFLTVGCLGVMGIAISLFQRRIV